MMKIILYTIPYEVVNEGEKINQLFDCGLEEIHIRKPEFTKVEMLSLLNSIESKNYKNIVLHNHFSLCSKFGLKGIHVKADYFEGLIGKVRKYLFFNEHTQVTTTINNTKLIQEVPEYFSSVFIGPLFKKYSENNIKKNFDTFELKKIVQKSEKKLFALGGIDFKTKANISNIGFSGLVLQSCIWKSDDIMNAFNAFKLNQTKKTELVDIKIA